MLSSGYFDLGGTFRSQLAEQTHQWLKSIIPQIKVTRIANITDLDQVGIITTLCIRPNSKHLSVSQGKGLSLLLAEISAMMESIEAYHAENPPRIALRGTYQQLISHHPLIDPYILPRSMFQKKNLQTLALNWVKGTELQTGKICFIPHILTQLDSTIHQAEHVFFNISSNGLAGGNNKDEAICHALYELIERDALFCWQQLSLEERKKTQIDLNTIDDPINQFLLTKFTAAKLAIKIWEITSALGIPAFQCALYDQNALRDLGIFTGSGCHLSKSIALSRAMTEAAQSRLTLISGSRDDIFPSHYQQSFSHNHFESIENGERHYQTLPTPAFKYDFVANKNYLLQTLKHHGFHKAILIDHEKSELAVPIVQLFVPGLQFKSRI